MRILLCHNFYQQAGGEDRCYIDEGTLLENNGHEVVRFETNNDHISGINAVGAAIHAIWSRKSYQRVREMIREHDIDVVHCTNTFPVISPAVYYACNRDKVPVIQSLHNYRLACANALLLRDGVICEDCVSKKLPISAVRHKCYRNSRLASIAVATMQATHNLAGSWKSNVDQFIALTEFGKDLFIRHGLPADKIFVKPNFVNPIPTLGSGAGDYALFVGRLSPEKGIEVLLEAWRNDACCLPLRFVGDGPLMERVKAESIKNPRVELTGHLPPEQVLAQMSQARFVVVPSLWYEGLPRTIVESLAVGTPVIASDVGPMAEFVRSEGGGIRFKLGSAGSLASAARPLCESRELANSLRPLARKEFESKFTASVNYDLLMMAYDAAARNSRNRAG